MAIRTPTPPVDFDDRDLYPLHEEDDVPETEFHGLQVTYLRDVLRARLPHLRVLGNICIYWVRGNTTLYRAPDVFVPAAPPVETTLRVYHTWQDPPILFAAEIGSRSTFREDEGPKLDIYAQHIRAAEYLYSNPPQGDLPLWRLVSGRYEEIKPESNGRVRSRELDLEIGIKDGFLRVYTLDGERLRSHEESERDRVAAEARAAEERALREDLERQLAELRAQIQDRAD